MMTLSVEVKNRRAGLERIIAGATEGLMAGGEIDRIIQRHLYKQLYDSKNEDGTPRPQSAPKGKKKPSTIRAYTKEGWNTENYLVRTGASTTLTGKNYRKGLRLSIKPEGMKILSYHIPESRYRGKIRWMRLAPNMHKVIVQEIGKFITKELK